MKNRKICQFYSLKYNPFSADIPAPDLYISAKLKDFCWRISQLAETGGFALIYGEPGSGKSASLRVLKQELSNLQDVQLGVLERPQSNTPDFYKELSEIFGVPLTSYNRWVGFNTLRQQFKEHIETTLYRPVLLIDEATLMRKQTLEELRLLSSIELDSKNSLTVVFAGDQRFVGRLQGRELLPLSTRIRIRFETKKLTPLDMEICLKHQLMSAGNQALMSKGLIQTMSEHAMGNYRSLSTMCNEMLVSGFKKEAPTLDEKLYFEVFHPTRTSSSKS